LTDDKITEKVYPHYISRIIKSYDDRQDMMIELENKLRVHDIYPRIIKIEATVYGYKCSECGVIFTEPREASNYCGRTYCHKCRRFEEAIDDGDFP